MTRPATEASPAMDAEPMKKLVVQALDDLKAVNTVCLDVRDLTDVMDSYNFV